MLQWMGGSRRKVTTSRMSTQKRQKQYFEQRKRQQQQQEQKKIGEDNYYEKPSTCNQHQNNNRSLDILSLMNLPPGVQEDNSNCPKTRRNSEGKLWRNGMPCSYQNTPRSPTAQRNKVSRVDPIDSDTIKVTNPSYQGETICQMKSSFSYPDIHNKTSNEDGGNHDQLKFSSNHQLSVLDMLGDVGANSSYEGNSSREAYVSFSIEGLGKVETETPVHSPQPTGRTISYNCSSPTKSKVTKRAHFSKSFKCRMDDIVPRRLDDHEPQRDDMTQDIDMRFCGNSSELPFYSSDIMDSYSKPKHNLSAVEEFKQFDDINFISKNAFGDKEVYCNYQDKAQHTWDGRKNSQFLDMNFHDEVEYDLSWKNWHWEADLNNADCLDIRNQEKADFYFEGLSRNKSTFPTSTGKFNILDSPVQYSNQRISENDFDFITPHDAWHTTPQRSDIGDVMNSSPWPFSKKEEERDSWSWPSEESCSSSAVKNQAAEKEPFNSMQMHRSRKHSTTQRTTTCKYDLNTNIKQTNYFPRENINGPPIPSNTSKKKMDLDSDCFFEERYGTRNVNSFSDHFKDPFDDDAKLFSKSSKCRITAEFPLYSNSFLDNQLHSSKGPPFPNIRSKSRIDHQEWEPYQDMEFSDILVHGTVSKDGGMKHSAISPPVSENLEFSVDDCDVLSVKNGTQVDAMDSEDSCSHLKEVDRIPETKESLKNTCCSEHEEASLLSASEVADKSKAVVDGEEDQNGSNNSSSCQPGLKEVEESEVKERNVEDKVACRESGDTTCQVMMFKSYVFQLLCMQQVLKQVSTC